MTAIIQGHNYLSWILTESGIATVDAGWDLYRGVPEADSDYAALSAASASANLPVTQILLTHDHIDHVADLPALLTRWPDARVYAHANSTVSAVTDMLQDGDKLRIGDVQIVAYHTPGHSSQRDELSFWLPEDRFLFSGDIAQPQGPSYGYANGPSPVPYFVDGKAYRRSLERLIALDPQQMRTGHGQLLGPEQSRQWLRVTLAVLQRIEEVAVEMVDRYPDRADEWLIESIYDQIADERNFGWRKANARKQPQSDSAPDRGTDYERFDVPGLRWAVRAARAVDEDDESES